MVSQTEFTLRPRTRGFHLITDEVVRNLPPLPQTGLLYLFIKHTSAALSINVGTPTSEQMQAMQISAQTVASKRFFLCECLISRRSLRRNIVVTESG